MFYFNSEINKLKTDNSVILKKCKEIEDKAAIDESYIGFRDYVPISKYNTKEYPSLLEDLMDKNKLLKE